MAAVDPSREWMYNRRRPGGGVTDEFKAGVLSFIQYAFSNNSDPYSTKIPCPCVKCQNRYFKNGDTVLEHLYRHGFEPNYYVWTYHGENDIPIRHFADEGTSAHPQPCLNDDEFRELFCDLAEGVAATNPNTNYADNFPSSVDQPNADAQAFYDMLDEENQLLVCRGSSTSPLFASAQLLQIKTDKGVSIEAFNEFIDRFKSILPIENNMPADYSEAKNKFRKLGMGIVKIDACPNDCILFYKEHQRRSKCPKCHTSRYQKELSLKGKRKAQKVLRYMPVTTRLQRLFLSKKTAGQMTWHHDSPRNDGFMTHPSHGRAWQMVDQTFPDFSAEPRNVRLGLCADGFTPFGLQARSYSIWPIMIVVYNLPPWLCMSKPFIFLSLLIPGRNSPGQNIDVYLRPLIDELNDLWSDGVVTWDAARHENFQLHALLMWTIGDFPAYGMLSGWSTHGKLACPICMADTFAFRLKYGGKPCWFDCHRRHLKDDHPFRFQTTEFTKDTIVVAGPPARVAGFEMANIVARLPPNEYGSFLTGNERYTGFGDYHNWRKRSIFWDLPYWSALPIRHVLDVMHIEKNVFDNILYTSVGTKDKRNKDDVKARKDMSIVCSRPALELRLQRGKMYKPKASYSLSASDVRVLCLWLKGIRFPDGFASNISNCVSRDYSRLEGLKSHDCHVFMQRLLPIALRDFIPDNLWITITELSNAFKDLTAPSLYTQRLHELSEDIPLILCKLEKVYPPGFFDSMEHLTVHLAEEALLCGPSQFRWMYPFERFIGDLKGKCKNNAFPEATICEAYVIHEITNFMSLYFPDRITTSSNRRPMFDDGGVRGTPGCYSMFSHPGMPVKTAERYETMDAELLHVAHTYIIMNCPELANVVEAFDNDIVRQQGRRALRQLSELRDTQLAGWLMNYVQNMDVWTVDGRLRQICYGPSSQIRHFSGYKTNGYKFRTYDRDTGKKTMHSGVCVRGGFDGSREFDYYGIIRDIVEVTYGEDRVVLFKCHWFGTNEPNEIRREHGLVQVNIKSQITTSDVFILAQQAQQVYYIPYPSTKQSRRSWYVVSKVMVRRSFFAQNLTMPEWNVGDARDDVYMDDEPRPTSERVVPTEVELLVDEMEDMEEVDVFEARAVQGANVDSSDYEPSDSEDDI